MGCDRKICGFINSDVSGGISPLNGPNCGVFSNCSVFERPFKSFDGRFGVGKSGSASIIDLSKTARPSYVMNRCTSFATVFVLLATRSRKEGFFRKFKLMRKMGESWIERKRERKQQHK